MEKKISEEDEKWLEEVEKENWELIHGEPYKEEGNNETRRED